MNKTQKSRKTNQTKPKDLIFEKTTQPEQKEKKQVIKKKQKVEHKKRLCTRRPQDYTPLLASPTRGMSLACSIAGLTHRATSRFVSHTLFLPRIALV